MKFLSWNCQGLGSPLTIQSLRVLVTQEKPSLVFLMETKNKEQKVLKLRRKLKFQNSYLVNPIGIGGGMALFWNDQLEISVEAATDHFIHVLCHLGIPSDWGATKKDMFAWILARVTMKLESPICQICKLEPETVEHTLLLCPWTSQIWSAYSHHLLRSLRSCGGFGRTETILYSVKAP